MAKEINIVVRAKDATVGTWKKVSKAADKLKKKLSKTFGGPIKAAKQFATAIALIGTAAVAVAGKMIGFASAAEEVDSKFAAVFKTTIKTARAVAVDLANSFDLADSTAKEMLSNTGDLLVGFGFTGEEALNLADKVSRLGIDLASFTNFSKGAGGATEALTKLLLGESEQAKSLGIVVRQGSDEYKNAVKAKQEDLGVTLLQAKALTALEMATEQSQSAIGDYERTQDGVANKTRKATEAFKAAKEELGRVIIETSNYAAVLELVAQKTRELTESGKADLYAQDVSDAFGLASEKVQKHGKFLGLLIPQYDRLKRAIKSVAAFQGAREGGASIKEALAAAATAEEDIKKHREDALVDIKKEKEAVKAAKDEVERKRQIDAKAVEAKAEALKKEKAAVEAVAKAQEKKAKAEEKAAKDALAAADLQTKFDEYDEKQLLKKEALAKDLIEAQKKLADLRKPVPGEALEKDAAKEGNVIAILQRQLAGVAGNREERRAAMLENRDKERDKRKEKELRDRVARGVVLGKDNAAFLKKKDLQEEIDARAVHKALLEFDAKEQREKAAQKALDRIVKATEDEVALLAANLKAAG